MNVAVEAVREAARKVERYDRQRGDLRIRAKGPGDLVTSADFASEKAVIEVLRKSYPKAGILSEEAGQDGVEDDCWVLDPVDGTTNFVHGFPNYVISLAWCRRGRPDLGVVYDISRNDLYRAERGGGAYCNDRRLRGSKTEALADALLGVTGGVRPEDWPLVAAAARASSGVRRVGSGALDFALAAAGSLDACFGHGLQYWDCAAGMLLVEEAGGVFHADAKARAGAPVPFGSRLGLCFYGGHAVVDGVLKLARRTGGE